MFKAIGAFFNMFFVLFTAGEKIAQSVDNLATIAVAESQGLADQMAIERQARIKQLTADVKAITSGKAA